MYGNLEIPTLGPCDNVSPLSGRFFVDDNEGVVLDPVVRAGGDAAASGAFERAGPRRRLFFQADQVRAAIVTCGGLCPGLNDVIRAVSMVLWHRYGVRSILGIRYGYAGLLSSSRHAPMVLTPDNVEDIHQHGGTILGSSRGPQEVDSMVDFLAEQKINMLFTIGGDGTQRGALAISGEAQRRGLALSVIGIPKTIDNDIQSTDRTFGFQTAVAMSRGPITCAHMEAKGVERGIGLVKLMGRESGFVAAFGALASSDVNLVLVPEVPFSMERMLGWLDERLQRKNHAVIVVAEGAGQKYVPLDGTDASGNHRLGDIGPFLKNRITEHFHHAGHPVSVKYMDPSYTIRSAPANADDSVFCFQLGERAAHAAMAGRTGMVVGHWSGHFVHIPMAMAVVDRKRIDPSGAVWQSVLDNTGQPTELV